MARRRKNGMWEEDLFEDISSDSRRAPGSRPESGRPQGGRPGERRPAPQTRRPARRDGFSSELPAWDTPSPSRGRPRQAGPQRTSQGRGGGGRPPQGRPRPSPPPRKRARKPLSSGARRLMMAVTVLVMAVATALLAVFLLFKISDIQVTGDVIEGCRSEDVLAVCGYKTGDNLFFVSTRDKEEKLKEQIPYIEEAKIIRHLPGTLEIRITGAQVASCVSYNGSWLYLSGSGKVLEEQAEPKEGVMQVFGLELADPQVGRLIAVEEPKAETQEASGSSQPESSQGGRQAQSAFTAYQAVSEELAELGAAGAFTSLDLSDLSNIRLTYQGRVEFRLGPAVELEYKINLGLSSVAKMAGFSTFAEMTEAGSDGKETGVLDLSGADQTKRAYFTEEEIRQGGPAQSSSQPSAQASPEPQGGEPAATPSPDPRGAGIPDAPYTGSISCILPRLLQRKEEKSEFASLFSRNFLKFS